MKNYVIIGNGVAGATAAENIRKKDRNGRITIFSDEPYPLYYRVRLPEVVAGKAEAEKITIRPQEWYHKNEIDLRLGEPAILIDPDKKEVKGEHGTKASYDALLLATGARSFIPPAPGADKAGVFALRNLADARAIKDRASKAEAAVLVGGGLLGLEAGYGLTRLGLECRVIEIFDRLLPRQMDPAGASKLQNILERMGFSFYLGVKLKEIYGDIEAEGLILEDGRRIPGGLILFSAGIRPNLDLAKAIGLETDKGVKVDDQLKTSREEVWAAGDLIEHRGRVYGIWPAAREQGEIAGVNMAGGSAVYKGTVMSNTLKVVGVDLTSAGDIDPEGKLKSAVYEDEDRYRKIVIDKEGLIAGAIFLGLTDGVQDCLAAMAKKAPAGRFLQEMKKKDFDFNKLI